MQAHKEQDFKWWVQRLRRAFQVYDETRIDHFRGFAGAYPSCRLLLRRACARKLYQAMPLNDSRDKGGFRLTRAE